LGLTVFLAYKIYQTRQENLAPTEPEAVSEDCTLEFSIKPPETLVCEKKLAYRNDSRNKSGYYYFYSRDRDGYEANIINNGEAVENGEIVVFLIDTSNIPEGGEIEYIVTDTLPSSLTFLDSYSMCSYDNPSKTVTCNDTATINRSHVAFRAKIADDASGTISNTATLRTKDGQESTCSITLTVASPPECYQACDQNNDLCPDDLVCQEINGSPVCVNPDCPEEEDCLCPEPVLACHQACDPDNDLCPDNLVCQDVDGSPVCVNPDCPEEEDCLCPEEPTATPIETTEAQPTQEPDLVIQASPTSPPPTALPEAGSILPTLGVILGGITLAILGFFFVF
jgi:hypothetical protein